MEKVLQYKYKGEDRIMKYSNESDKVFFSFSEELDSHIYQFDEDKPIFINDLYELFPNIPKGTIRQIMKRLHDKGEIERAEQGIYYKPNSNRVLNVSNLSSNKIIREKYMLEGDKIIGYKSGLSFANQIDLTTQIPQMEVVVSNAVSNKKRKIYVNNAKIILQAPRISVTNDNYKLLQVMDLMNDFKNLSEYSLERSSNNIMNYLTNVNSMLEKEKIEQCVEVYPLRAQVNFYKSGVYHELIKKQRGF